MYADVTGHVIDSHINGIPCKIRIDHFRSVPGTFSEDAMSSADYYGYSEIEFTVLDRKGYVANWLARKLTSNLEDRIQGEILEYAECQN